MSNQSRLSIVPCSLEDANAFVAALHRHHDPVVGHKWSLAVMDSGGGIRGVAIVGRPVARRLEAYLTLEVNRVATDGCPNACSALYGAARRQILAHGWTEGITYTLASESGTSLKASGWTRQGTSPGRSWDCESRPREDDARVLGEKVRWGFGVRTIKPVLSWPIEMQPAVSQSELFATTPEAA